RNLAADCVALVRKHGQTRQSRCLSNLLSPILATSASLSALCFGSFTRLLLALALARYIL
ncbi:MAG TPA: hypothetical protein VN729_12390, partial [Ktedonobacteraceae bacterium]|nr:hypothetical protein [Ktedonobacteraceae bacterium]